MTAGAQALGPLAAALAELLKKFGPLRVQPRGAWRVRIDGREVLLKLRQSPLIQADPLAGRLGCVEPRTLSGFPRAHNLPGRFDALQNFADRAPAASGQELDLGGIEVEVLNIEQFEEHALVEPRRWVPSNAREQDNQLSVSAQVKSVRPLHLIASARAQGPVDQFSVLTGQLVSTLLEQLPVEVPGPLAERLQHPEMTSLAARRLLAESEVGGTSKPQAAPGASRSAVPPGAWLWPSWLRLPITGAAHADMGGPRTSLAAQSPDIEAELRMTLEGYRKALEGKDLATLRSYYEDFTDSQRAALTRYFESADDLRIEFDDVRVAIIGDDAAVSFTRHDRFTDRGTGQPQHATVRVTKRFARQGGGWVIQREP